MVDFITILNDLKNRNSEKSQLNITSPVKATPVLGSSGTPVYSQVLNQYVVKPGASMPDPYRDSTGKIFPTVMVPTPWGDMDYRNAWERGLDGGGSVLTQPFSSPVKPSTPPQSTLTPYLPSKIPTPVQLSTTTYYAVKDASGKTKYLRDAKKVKVSEFNTPVVNKITGQTFNLYPTGYEPPLRKIKDATGEYYLMGGIYTDNNPTEIYSRTLEIKNRSGIAKFVGNAPVVEYYDDISTPKSYRSYARNQSTNKKVKAYKKKSPMKRVQNVKTIKPITYVKSKPLGIKGFNELNKSKPISIKGFGFGGNTKPKVSIKKPQKSLKKFGNGLI